MLFQRFLGININDFGTEYAERHIKIVIVLTEIEIQ